ncbi:MAG: putative CRISPR-associated protein [Oscillatoriales cyanobacterium]|nr:MAG: putative CRISPR-associated protein [Oscillatoriales cyanobacterium]
MARLVISTVGTSVLTNQIDRDIDDNDCYEQLQRTANYTDKEIQHYPEIKKIISELKERAEKELYSDDTDKIRKASAELNGIYSLYNEPIEQGIPDMHLLVTTDTAQGRVAAEVVESFLKSKGLTNISTHAQSGLSTASSDIFVEGMAKLIPSIQETIKGYKNSRYMICFNLVGGFKALQGYFNTIGMFYADEIIYVFEGSNQLIKIPKLPVKVDVLEIDPYKVQLAMMEAGEISTSWKEAKKVPEQWILVDGQEMILSAWGKLVWDQCKEELLSQKLLNFPKIDYKSSFSDDYQKIKNNLEEQVKLQETIAKASQLLQKSGGDTSILKTHPGLQYDKYSNMKKYTNINGDKFDIAHFRVTDGIRVSCTSSNGILLLHRYGKEPEVNRNPY